MFGRMGPLEIGLILVIILIIFGVGRLPQVGNALGKAIRSFRKGQQGEEEEEEEERTSKKNMSAKKVSRKAVR